jgi:hypothetical protein
VINLSDNDGTRKIEISEKFQKDIEKLLNSDLEQRFLFVEKLDDKDTFLVTLTAYFRQQLLNISRTPRRCPDIQNFLQDLVEAQKWSKQNVNIRAILEYLMLKIPKIEKHD